MANKFRAKKVKAPYKRYVYSSGEGTEPRQANNSNQDEQLRSKLNIRTVHVLTRQDSSIEEGDSIKHKARSYVWPQSQFQKVDLVRCYLDKGNKEYEASRLQQQQDDYDEVGDHEAEEDDDDRHNMMKLPIEVMKQIFEILHYQGHLTSKYMILNKAIYGIVAQIIYGHPWLYPNNFNSFTEVITRNKSLGGYIQTLDLTNINHGGKNASISKLLKRSGKSLRKFVAPQTSFGLGPLVSLKNCPRLKVLDLRLVSEAMNLFELFKAIKNHHELTHLSLPRCSIQSSNEDEEYDFEWPPRLSFLHISGGISDEFIIQTRFPSTICELELSHCSSLRDIGFVDVLLKIGKNLTSLRIQYPMSISNAGDSVFLYCPNLITLEVNVDYILLSFFDEHNLKYLPYQRPLKNLRLGSSGTLGTYNRIEPVDLAVALDEGRLPKLTHVQVSTTLGWMNGYPEDCLEYVIETLDERNGLFRVYMG